MCDAAVTSPKSNIPKYCKYCDVWLREYQWEEHIEPSQVLHQKNKKRAEMGFPMIQGRRKEGERVGEGRCNSF